jgi:hypothetical protein
MTSRQPRAGERGATSVRWVLPAAAATGRAGFSQPSSPTRVRRPGRPSRTSGSSHHGDRAKVSNVVLVVVVGQVAANQVDTVVPGHGIDPDRRSNGLGVLRAHRGGQPRAPQRA